MKAVGYVRTSAKDDESIDAQRERVEAWTAERGHALVAVEEDNGISGARDEAQRAGLAAALGALEDGRATALVVHRLDRLARALHVQEAILARAWGSGAEVYEVVGGLVRADDPDDPMRTFARQVMGAAAQLERGLVTARLQAGRKRKAAGGGYVGGQRTYGYRIEDDRLVPVPEEQAVIRRIRGWARRGWSLRKIAARLNEDGVPTATGSRWGVSQLHYLLARSGR